MLYEVITQPDPYYRRKAECCAGTEMLQNRRGYSSRSTVDRYQHYAVYKRTGSQCHYKRRDFNVRDSHTVYYSKAGANRKNKQESPACIRIVAAYKQAFV